MIKKVFYNAGAQIIGKVITASSTLFITIIIARSLGNEGYGDFTKVFVFVGYFYTVADFGLNTVFIKNENQDKVFIKYLAGLRLIIGFCLVLTAILISLFLPYNHQLAIGFSPQVKLGIAIASLTILTQALFTTANAYFQKNLRYDLSTVAAISGTFVTLILTAVGSLLHFPFDFYVGVYTFGGITFVFTAYFLIKVFLRTSILPAFSSGKFKEFIKDAWPVGTALIFNLIYFRLDILILSYARSSAEVGVYGLAYQFFEASLSIPIFFANALFPLLTNLHKKDKPAYQKEVKRWAGLLLGISALLMAALVFLSFSIPLIFKGQFIASQSLLVLLSAGLPFFFISALLWHILIIENKQKYLGGTYLAGAIFNLLANLFLIPKYGALAAAATTVVSELVIVLILFICYKFTVANSKLAISNLK